MLSRINGGNRNGGYTLRLPKGETEINGRQALALARTRKNLRNPSEDDLTRARRQQQLVSAMKDKVTSFETFIRLPWVSWAAPKAVRSDMAGPTLLGVAMASMTGGDSEPRVLKPSGGVDAARRRRGAHGRRRDQAGRGRAQLLERLSPARGARVGAGRRGRRATTRRPSFESDFSLRLRVVLVGAGLGGGVHLALALGRPVVGVVEAGSLEVDRDRVEDALHRAPRRSRTR